MKVLAIVALLLALGSVAASVFAKVETHGNYEYMKHAIETEGPRTKYDLPLLEDYKSTLNNLHYAAWAAGGLALVLGAVVLARKGGKVIPGLACLLGAVGAGLAFASMP